MSVDIGTSLRTALVNSADVTSRVGAWMDSYSIHTRIPVPDTAPYPMIVIQAPSAFTDEDALASLRDVVVRTVATYGTVSEHYRVVEQLGYIVRDLFHRNPSVLTVAGHRVYGLSASGPIVVPSAVEGYVGRAVTVTARMQGAA